MIDLEPFRPPASPGPIWAVFGPSRKRTSRRPERRTGTRVQRDDPSLKVNDDEHDDEHHEDDDDDDANKCKVSSKDPRRPEIKFRIPKPTSGHQAPVRNAARTKTMQIHVFFIAFSCVQRSD